MRVLVDGIEKGEVFKRAGRWFWRRGEIAIEPFAKGSTLDDVADWARKCCNGKVATIVKDRRNMSMDTMALCELCGEVLPYGEHMFKYHGHSGPCPKPPKQTPCDEVISPAVERAMKHFWKKANEYEKAGRHDAIRAFYNDMIELQQRTDVVSISKVLDALDPVLQLLDAAVPA